LKNLFWSNCSNDRDDIFTRCEGFSDTAEFSEAMRALPAIKAMNRVQPRRQKTGSNFYEKINIKFKQIAD